MAKRKPLPDWAHLTAGRIKRHNIELQELADAIADNPSDRKRVVRLIAVAAIIGDNIDQLINPEMSARDENGNGLS